MEPHDDDDAAYWAEVEEATELLQEQNWMKALIELRLLLERSPSNPYAYHFLGAALYESGEKEAARDAYRKALTIAPDYLGSRVGLSHVLRELGDVDGALFEANQALRRFPKDGDAMHAAGMAHAAKGQRKLAKKELEGYLSSNPSFEAQTEVRQILEMLGLGEEGDPLEVDDEG